MAHKHVTMRYNLLDRKLACETDFKLNQKVQFAKLTEGMSQFT